MFQKTCKKSDKNVAVPLSDLAYYSDSKISTTSITTETYFSTENILPNKEGYKVASNLPQITSVNRCLKGSTLISNIRPYFKKIVFCQEETAGCSADVLCVVPKQSIHSALLFCSLYEDSFFDYVIAGSKGTKMPRGDKSQIMKYPIYCFLPPQKENVSA